MDLGAFSVSLSVKDLEASRSFYEKFGFKVLVAAGVIVPGQESGLTDSVNTLTYNRRKGPRD